MDTTGTKWLSRKAWRRLVELHATGRITRPELVALQARLARVRHQADAAPGARPALRLVQGGGAARAATRAPRPTPQEVA